MQLMRPDLQGKKDFTWQFTTTWACDQIPIYNKPWRKRLVFLKNIQEGVVGGGMGAPLFIPYQNWICDGIHRFLLLFSTPIFIISTF